MVAIVTDDCFDLEEFRIILARPATGLRLSGLFVRICAALDSTENLQARKSRT